MEKTSEKNKWGRIGPSLCSQTRQVLDNWKQSGISLPTAIEIGVRLAKAGEINAWPIEGRKDCVQTGFQLTEATILALRGLSVTWGCSVSDAIDRIIVGMVSAVDQGLQVDLSLILPAGAKED